MTEKTAEARAVAVERHQAWLAAQPDLVARVKAELRDRDLACWCPLDQPCHADVLLVMANEP